MSELLAVEEQNDKMCINLQKQIKKTINLRTELADELMKNADLQEKLDTTQASNGKMLASLNIEIVKERSKQETFAQQIQSLVNEKDTMIQRVAALEEKNQLSCFMVMLLIKTNRCANKSKKVNKNKKSSKSK